MLATLSVDQKVSIVIAFVLCNRVVFSQTVCIVIDRVRKFVWKMTGSLWIS